MFVYFIQKKEFLGGDQYYLRNKLAESKKRGKTSFIGSFICSLFFEGFARLQNSAVPIQIVCWVKCRT